MRCLTSIVLTFAFLALGSGLVERLHNDQHDRKDALLTAARAHEGSDHEGSDHDGSDHDGAPLHDDSNCSIHAQLHAPLLTQSWVAVLVCLGLFVAFLTEVAAQPVARLFARHVDCRGPPVLS